MLQSQEGNNETVRYRYSLSTMLYKSPHVYEILVDDMWLLYAPDAVGLPVLVSPQLHEFLDLFHEGQTVGQLAGRQTMRTGSLPDALRSANWLFSRGFLLDHKAPYQHKITDPHSEEASHPESLQFWIHITNYCNLACQYCFVEGKSCQRMADDVIDLTVRRIGTTVRRYKLRSILIKFAGGEPTLATARIDRFMRMLQRELAGTCTKVETTLLTNGTLFNTSLLDLLRRMGFNHVNISLDGYGEKHNIYRVFKGPQRVGSWTIIERNIERFQDAAITVNINCTISAESAASLPDLMKWAVIERGIYNVRLNVVHNLLAGSWEAGCHEGPLWSAQLARLREGFEKAFLVLESPDVELDLRYRLQIADLSFDIPHPDITCGIGWNHIVLRHDGRIAACPMTVNEQAFEPSDDLFETARRTFSYKPRDLVDPRCRSCLWYKTCACGCPVTNKRLSSNPFARSSLCEFYQYVIPRWVLFYGRKLQQLRRRMREAYVVRPENCTGA